MSRGPVADEQVCRLILIAGCAIIRPHGDEEAYEQSSPICFAENFRRNQHLVILHGMVGANVHFSDLARLTQRLIELVKENWELAVTR